MSRYCFEMMHRGGQRLLLCLSMYHIPDLFSRAIITDMFDCRSDQLRLRWPNIVVTGYTAMEFYTSFTLIKISNSATLLLSLSRYQYQWIRDTSFFVLFLSSQLRLHASNPASVYGNRCILLHALLDAPPGVRSSTFVPEYGSSRSGKRV
ncbi:hypothetical protein BDZ97DRAFT_1076064 [Flammula alnicola]|nr:hypothetical protein BDZ97DRAFT_1076064 [Flammula alnicola]